MESIEQLFSLKGKIAIITGACGYFGKAFCEALLSAGAEIIILGRGAKVKLLKEKLQFDYGNKVWFCDVDFNDTDKYRSSLKDACEGGVDILINNAYDISLQTGFNSPTGRIEFMTKEQWQSSFECGIYWHALAIQIVGEIMKTQNSGSIINISSMYGIVSPDPKLYEGTVLFNPVSYSTMKSGLIGLTKYTAAFYGKYNIRCNAIAPGSFPNLNPDAFNSPKNDEFIKRLSDKTLLNRTGMLKDLIGPLIFLASDASSYITGQTISVDGGWTTI